MYVCMCQWPKESSFFKANIKNRTKNDQGEINPIKVRHMRKNENERNRKKCGNRLNRKKTGNQMRQLLKLAFNSC